MSIITNKKTGRKFDRIDAATTALGMARLQVRAAMAGCPSFYPDGHWGLIRETMQAERLHTAARVVLDQRDYAGGGAAAPLTVAEAEQIVTDAVISEEELLAG